MSYYLMILVGAVLVNNFVLSRFLGCCPFLGVSKKLDTAIGMSGAVVFVMTVASAVTWCLDHWLLAPNGLGYIHTLAFILVIAALVQFIDIAMKRFLPPLHAALGIFLPLITTNCAVLGAAEINCKQGTGFFEAVSPAVLPRHSRRACHRRAPLPRVHGLLGAREASVLRGLKVEVGELGNLKVQRFRR